MVEVRACLYFSVIVLCFHIAAGKPIFDFLWCDFACDDYDDVSTSTTTSTEDYDDWCDWCPNRRRRTTTTTTRPPMMNGPQMPVSFSLLPSNGMNVTLNNDGLGWFMNLVPWMGQTPSPGGVAPATAAPAATTAAPAATTTAAVAATTAAPVTTAAP